MSVFAAPSFYNQADQNIFNQGDRFITQQRFRLGDPIQKNINFDSGITNAAAATPFISPINQGGGGGQNNFGIDDRGLITTDFKNFEPNYSYTPPAYDDFPPQQNMFQKAFGSIKDTIKDKAGPIFGGILSAATGIPFLGQGLQALTNQFENRPLGAAVIDEFGNVYDEDELNSMNALGGYYTDAARSARRRTARIANMLERQRLGKKFSLANLQKLQAQEQKQEEIRQAAAKAMQDRNRAEGRGGYQSNFAQDRDFMEGRGGGPDAAQESTSPGSSGPGGSDTMGSFAYGGRVPYMMGGLANLVDIYD